MDPAVVRTPAPVAFEDGLGERHHTVDAANEPLEVLTLRKELTAVPSFEFALRERVSRLASFRHACYGHVRGVERLDNVASTLAIVSDRIPGVRLSGILAVAEKELLPVEFDAGLCLIRQLVQAVAMLHEHVPDVCHGAIAPERIIVTPNARLVIVEQVLGAALGQLQFSRERYWKELRVPLPPRAGVPRFDRRTDVMQVGAIALSLILGRPLGDDDYPARIAEIAGRVGAVSATGGLEPLPDGVRSWLARALQLDLRSSFASAVEALGVLNSILGDSDCSASPAALESFLTQYYSCTATSRASSEPAPGQYAAVAPSLTVASWKASPAAPAASPEPLASPASSPTGQLSPAPKSATPTKHSETKASADETAAPIALEPSAPRQPKDVQGTLQSRPEAEVDMPPRTAPSRRWMIAAAVALIALVSGGTLAARRFLMPSAAAESTGTLVVNTNPAGAGVVIDGQPRGLSPVTVGLTPGDHVLELVTESDRRTIPVTITAGGQVSQFIEMPKIGSRLGRLQIRTEPSGARVTVDGQVFGRSPVTIENLTPGPHVVTLENELGSVKEDVTIEAGATASLVVPLAGPQGAPVSGWISVIAPVDVQLFENRRLLGSSRSDRIMVGVGRHDVEIVNEALGYRGSHSVQVAPGQVSSIKPAWPKGSLAINALPWAEVWIDGERIGETPIGSVALPIGPHEIVFRHPELGEQRHQTTVTLAGAARLSVDLRKK